MTNEVQRELKGRRMKECKVRTLCLKGSEQPLHSTSVVLSCNATAWLENLAINLPCPNHLRAQLLLLWLQHLQKQFHSPNPDCLLTAKQLSNIPKLIYEANLFNTPIRMRTLKLCSFSGPFVKLSLFLISFVFVPLCWNPTIKERLHVNASQSQNSRQTDERWDLTIPRTSSLTLRWEQELRGLPGKDVLMSSESTATF